MLIAVIYAFFRYGERSNSIYKKQSNLTVGIGGIALRVSRHY